MPPLPIQIDSHFEAVELNYSPAVENLDIDLQAYIAPYSGLPRIHRLEFIADHCKSLRISALTMAIDYIKNYTCNCKDYLRLFKKLQDAWHITHGYDGMPVVDSTWIDTKTKHAGLRLERLENDLKNYRSNSVKESIRLGQDYLGDHYLDCGELELAFAAYSKSREYALSPRNTIIQCLNMVRVSILLNRWPAVSNHVIKAEGQNVNETNPAVATKLHCAAGLYELSSRNFKKAATHFLSTNYDHFAQSNNVGLATFPSNPESVGIGIVNFGASTSGENNDNGMILSSSSTMPSLNRDIPSAQYDFLSPTNIAIYGSLCAVATFSRKDLAAQVINSSSFRQFLEFEPQVREAVQKFHEAKYAACLKILDDIKNLLLIDMYLAPHIDRLYRTIRNKALIQYFEPYSAADMSEMAKAFNTTVVDLENEMISLICDGQIKARIDSHNKILYAKDTNTRTAIFERTLNVGKAWQRQTRALISRSAVINAGLCTSLSSSSH